ncbi:sensor domain-containing diguanylate cyclase [Marinobacter zhejiangensis]|uniref:diguanylate cyclase n=1 Tax=Marinobacter zhejiangensis TaxID=488535 RepID=A0A1I4NEA8_9GAMM|nr:diguanylate cyclase [Marinobacter zhejiangensis]SFM13902.1 diguanylate cyclase [Marinobacter zhejiangensis]
MSVIQRVLLVLVGLLCSVGVHSTPLVWQVHSQSVEAAPFVDYLQEPVEGLDFEQVRDLAESRWTRNGAGNLSFGYGEEAYWFRLTIKPQASRTSSVLLELAYPVLDKVDVYVQAHGELAQTLRLGDKLPFYDRPIEHRNFLVPLTLEAGTPVTVFLRVETSSSMQVPIMVWDEEAFYVADQSGSISEGIYFGIFLAMILYNLFVYLATGERSFLYYVAYITSLPLFLASLTGLSFQYLWPEATWWNDQAIVVFLNLVAAFGGIFSMRFLNVLPTNHPRLSQMMVLGVTTAFVLAVAGLMVPYHLLIMPTIVVAATGCVVLLSLTVYRWLLNEPMARYYAVAWALMLFGGIVLALSKFTMLPRNLVTEYATQLGSALGVILLSMALANRLSKEKQLAFLAQQRLLQEERKVRLAQEKSLVLQQDANARLEERVQERTRDLEKLNAQLLELSATDALTGLKNRAHFDDSFQTACVRAYRFEQPLSLLLVDVDHFKQFNDTYGHTVGDDCLRMVADTIRQVVTRPQDLAARYGGEEFVVLLPDTPEEGAIRVAEKIRTAVERMEFRISEQVIGVTVSVGVAARVPDQAEQTKELFELADIALYQAKGQGRNRVIGYTEHAQNAATEQTP